MQSSDLPLLARESLGLHLAPEVLTAVQHLRMFSWLSACLHLLERPAEGCPAKWASAPGDTAPQRLPTSPTPIASLPAYGHLYVTEAGEGPQSRRRIRCPSSRGRRAIRSPGGSGPASATPARPVTPRRPPSSDSPPSSPPQPSHLPDRHRARSWRPHPAPARPALRGGDGTRPASRSPPGALPPDGEVSEQRVPRGELTVKHLLLLHPPAAAASLAPSRTLPERSAPSRKCPPSGFACGSSGP